MPTYIVLLIQHCQIKHQNGYQVFEQFYAAILILNRRRRKNVRINLALLDHKYSIFAGLMEWCPSLAQPCSTSRPQILLNEVSNIWYEMHSDVRLLSSRILMVHRCRVLFSYQLSRLAFSLLGWTPHSTLAIVSVVALRQLLLLWDMPITKSSSWDVGVATPTICT